MNQTERMEKSFWENVLVVLTIRKRTLTWLEREAGLAKNMISHSTCQRTRIRLSTVLRVCRVLGYKPEDLLYGHHVLLTHKDNQTQNGR